MENKLQHASLMPKDLTFHLLEEITNSFSEKHKVGSGGYGEVYKGVLHNGEVIAVKKLYHIPGLNDEQFKKEFNSLMRVQHQNIIRLVGYCYEIRHKHIEIKGEYVFAKMEERALCFEYLQCGGLHKHLSDESCGLDWNTRYNIIKGICKGLNYLHNASNDSIYHLDLKPANILLDGSMMPKIADFGLARLFGTTQTHTTKNFIGTIGYMPPEYIDKRQISKKYDVFSLGVIIIQIMTGPLGYSKCADISSQQFVELVCENWKKRLQAGSTYASLEADCLEVKTCIEMALQCVEVDRVRRPTIAEVIDKLDEIETLKRSLVGQSSDQSKESLGIDPCELRFPFELDREISSVLQLSNKSDDFIAFSVKMNHSKYHTRPDKGVMPPWSKCYVVVTMQAQKRAPPDMQCNDMFLLQRTRVKEGFGPSDITEALFEKTVGKVMDEVKLQIVYVPLPHPQ